MGAWIQTACSLSSASTRGGTTGSWRRRPACPNLDHGSAFQTFRHLVDVDWSWREGLLGNDVGETYVWDHGFALDDLVAIHAFCLEEDARLRSYVESLDDAALAESLARAQTSRDRDGWSSPTS